MSKKRITEDDSAKIQSLLSQPNNFTWQDISNYLENVYSLNQIQYHVKKHFPSLKKNIKKEYSRGGSKLEYLLKQIFPSNKIVSEFHIGERLRVDFYIKEPFNLAFEFDGSQHSEFSPHFHGDRFSFQASEERDKKKSELLNKRGVNLVRISTLDIDDKVLKTLIDQVGYGTGIIQNESLTKKEKQVKRLKELQAKQKQLQKEKQNPYILSLKEKQKEYRKQQYQRLKEWKKNNK